VYIDIYFFFLSSLYLLYNFYNKYNILCSDYKIVI